MPQEADAIQYHNFHTNKVIKSFGIFLYNRIDNICCDEYIVVHDMRPFREFFLYSKVYIVGGTRFIFIS